MGASVMRPTRVESPAGLSGVQGMPDGAAFVGLGVLHELVEIVGTKRMVGSLLLAENREVGEVCKEAVRRATGLQCGCKISANIQNMAEDPAPDVRTKVT